SFQAEVDLNKYFIMILNNDQSISVVDPLMGMTGITQLYAMIIMEGRGEDWTRSVDDKLLFVTMPRVDKVAVVDLETFKVTKSAAAGKNPVRISLQPDGRYLWVGNDAKAEAESGVTVLDARTHEVVARIATGPGHHEIAFSADSRVAFVTNAEADTLSLIDIQRLAKVADLPTGRRPLAVQFSDLRQAAYVASRDGTVAVVDSTRREIVTRIETGSGLTAFRLSPDGRWGFVANGDADRVDVLDISSDTIAHRLEAGDQPHQFAFTQTYAYVRHLGTADVLLIPLSQLSLGTEPGVQRVPLGTRAPGEYPYLASADAISPTGEWTAVVSANPADLTVHYYMEGMIAPMGSYSTYGRVPRAVSVVDRSLRETERGLYTSRFRVPSHGDYDVAFLIDSPFIDHCFTFSAVENPEQAAELERNPVKIVYLNEERNVPAGEPIKVRFTLTDARSEEPLTGLKGVVVLATRPPGSWQERIRATPLENGVYEVMVPADRPGAYYVSVAVPSLGLDFTALPYISFLTAKDMPSAKQDTGG
ncbi:MAG TPA: cytochrome D1 domain-containing protein, partial [Pseudomonadales bacterium]